jgi:fatty-acyl-CoA synthase
MDVTHPYGLTETYGPAAICDWRPEGDKLDSERQSASKARQGVANIISEPIRVRSPAVTSSPTTEARSAGSSSAATTCCSATTNELIDHV